MLTILIIRLRPRMAPDKEGRFTQKTPTKASFFTAQPQHRIGVITPLPNSSALFLEQGLKQALQHSPNATYEIIMYSGDNSRVTLFNHAVEALKKCNIVVPFGLACTNIVHEAARHTKKTTPVIFTGIKSCHLPLLREQNIKENLVGIISKRDHMTQLSQLRAIKPGLSNVLIVYRQQLEWILQEVEEIVGNLTRDDVGALAYLLPHSTHIDNQLSTIKKPFDTIIVMPRTLNAKGLQEMITYCNIKGITLVANDLDAVTLGAAVGFGGEEVGMGVRAGKAIRDLLEINKPLVQKRIIEHIDHYQVHLNQRTLEQQGVLLSPALLFLLRQGEISHVTTMQDTPKDTPVDIIGGTTPQRAPSPHSSLTHKFFIPRGLV